MVDSAYFEQSTCLSFQSFLLILSRCVTDTLKMCIEKLNDEKRIVKLK